MKILKIGLALLITVGLCSIVALSVYYYRNYKTTNLLQENAKNKTGATTLTKKQEVQDHEKFMKEHIQELVDHGDCYASEEMYQANELEGYLLTMLQGDKWNSAVSIIEALLYYCKWSPDKFSMKIRDALVDVLDREIKRYKPPYDFREGSEMLTLIYDVCNLYDPRALPPILQLNELKCLSLYGNIGAGIVLSATAVLKTKIASTKQEVVDLSFTKLHNIMALGGFTNSPTTWNSLSPDIQRKIKGAIYDSIKDKDWGVRVWAIKALVPIADNNDILLLKKYLKDPDDSVREEAQKALTQRSFLWDLLDREAQIKIKDNIYNKLKDKDWTVRLESAKELAPIADKNDIPILEKLSKDPVSYVSEIANKTLEELKAKDTSH